MKSRGAIAILASLLFALVAARSLRAQGGGNSQQVGGNVNLPSGGDVEVWDGHVPQTRLQMRDLGLAPFDVIPAGESAITSLAVGTDGNVYGGTTGVTANLFVFSPGHNFVFPLGTIPGEESVFHSLVAAADGMLYLGTGRDPYRIYHPREHLKPGPNWYYETVTLQIREDYAAYPGGHLYRYDPDSTAISFLQEDFRLGRPAALTDLGIPVANEGIHALLMDTRANVIYGITYPGSQFFRYDVGSGETTVMGALNRVTPQQRYLPMISRVLVQDREGNVYANTDHGHLIRYRPGDDGLEILPQRLPGLSGRELFNRIDAAVLHPDGGIYGGTSDGYLFRFDPATGAMRNLGKPLMETGIGALAVGRDDMIYGVGGERDGVARLFVYDPHERSLRDLGMLEVAWMPYAEWKGFTFDAMVAGADGSLFLGNSEHRSRLFIYNP